ncbi:hypothetical protein LARI1_G007603 [Lachnellula arida]|uniref:Uncharacterized protein n=1 Tax=Lachnellula arida TaxID=1316785 RepID=A0A8T9B8Z1_9HELO|nr:hypothetical protein LARI1_G007603 [Lachnellula arida]
MAPRYAPLVHAFWTSPQALDIVSNIARVDLVPVMNYEICHTNVQLGPGAQKDIFNRRTTEVEPREISQPIVPWHRDSHPFVCVVMLSNAEYMLDGETGPMSGDGTITKVRSPQCGHAVVLQGRSVSHIAIPGENMAERITIVCSIRPRDPRLFDSSTNTNIRNKSLVLELND